MKILVVQVGRYGDLILTTPLLYALKQHYTQAEIHVLASERYHDLLQGQSFVDVVHVYRKKVLDVLQSFRSLRAEQFDIYIDPKDHFSQESTFFARVVHSASSIGFNAPGKTVFQHSLPSSTENEAHNPPLHVVDRNLHALKYLNISAARRRPILDVAEESRAESLRMAPPYKEGVKMIVLNISAGQESRHWPADHWIQLGQALAQRGQRLQILAAPADHSTARSIASGIGERASVYASTNIHQAIALIERCDLLVSADSAPVHIASAFNTPVVAMYNSVIWNLHKFGPLSTRYRIVQPELEGEIADIQVRQLTVATQSLLNEVTNNQNAAGI